MCSATTSRPTVGRAASATTTAASAATSASSGSTTGPTGGVNYRYWGAMTKWDLSLSWRLNKYATMFVQSRNPTNQKDLFYETPPGAAKGQGKHLRSMEEYGDNWIFGVRGQF
jgi:hypothetical protein